jgi:hypothetical protein
MRFPCLYEPCRRISRIKDRRSNDSRRWRGQMIPRIRVRRIADGRRAAACCHMAACVTSGRVLMMLMFRAGALMRVGGA